MRVITLLILGVVLGVVLGYMIPASKKTVICESGEETRIYEDYTLWVSSCKYLGTDVDVVVRMVD